MTGMDTVTAILIATIGAGTPLVFAALGELVAEKSGVLNLGVEGMMLVGAITGFIVAAETGSLVLAVLTAAVAGAGMAGIFGLLTLTFMANQVASGLALTIFGVGVSAFLGLDYTGVALAGVPAASIPWLSHLPFVGAVLFSLDPLVYLAFASFGAVAWFLYRTHAGLILRSVGESPASAHALGYPVIRLRYLAVCFGGAMAGLGGVYLSIAYTPMWVEAMTAGRGWIALALVVFSTWRPARAVVGAYLFGGVTIIQLHAQGAGVEVASQFLSMLPYLATIAVLVVISRDVTTIRLHQPASLGLPFHPDST